MVLGDAAKRAKIEENRKLIYPVIKCVMLCGRQGIPLRGRNERSGSLVLNDSEESEGNFTAILRFGLSIAEQDELRSIREKCAKNATYTSPDIQNEILTICGNLILKKITDEVRKTKYFAILADETTDVSKVEQFSLCIRYVDDEKYEIVERFLEFVPLNSTTGMNMANVILDKLNEMGIETEYMRGQGYDGAAAMSGKFNGVQAIIKRQINSAMYVHCSNHCLNLALSTASDLPSIKNTTGTVESVYDFFNTPKRQTCLENHIDEAVKKKKLVQYNPTRWIERQTSITVFTDLQLSIISALEEISQWDDRKTSASAQQLLTAIRASEFNIILRILNSILMYTLPLSLFLQKENIDLAAAVEYAENVVTQLRFIRSKADEKFSALFAEIEKVHESIGFDIDRLPRLCGRQTHRGNAGVSSPTTPQTYYRINVFIPFLDSVIAQIEEKFITHKNILKMFHILLSPKKIFSSEEEEVAASEELIEMYKDDLGSSGEVKAEIELWRMLLRKMYTATADTKTMKGMELLKRCNDELYPNVYKLLKIFCCLPFSNAYTEKSFSSLKRLKTYLRNTMSEQRLNGLAHLNIHTDIKITPEEVLEEFCKKTRRLDFKF